MLSLTILFIIGAKPIDIVRLEQYLFQLIICLEYMDASASI